MARILLVEDDPDLLFLLEHILRVEGHSINAVRTVSDALSLLECGFYDLAITDGRLPDGTGMMVGDKAVEKGHAPAPAVLPELQALDGRTRPDRTADETRTAGGHQPAVRDECNPDVVHALIGRGLLARQRVEGCMVPHAWGEGRADLVRA